MYAPRAEKCPGVESVTTLSPFASFVIWMGEADVESFLRYNLALLESMIRGLYSKVGWVYLL